MSVVFRRHGQALHGLVLMLGLEEVIVVAAVVAGRLFTSTSVTAAGPKEIENR